jgi:glycine/D-amino acid oxidase-like deaminating enzyme
VSPDVAVVGCGGLGLSVAYHLARRGARVVAIDRAEPGSQTSARAAGLSVVVQAHASVGAVMRRGLAELIAFAERSPEPVRLRRVGSVKLACSTWAAEQLVREVAGATRLDVRVEMIDLDDVAELAPHVDTAKVVAAWHTPDDLYFEPPQFLRGLRAAAEAAGVELMADTEVESVNGGVLTSAGRIEADTVVVAAGAWAEPLLAGLGVRLPLCLVRHQYAVRGPVAAAHTELPIVRAVDDALYCRCDGDGFILGTYEPRPLVLEPDRVPHDIAALELDVTPAASDLFPDVARAPLREMRGGIVSMTPDGLYLIDEVGGVFFVAGCNVRGLSVALALGEDVAEWVSSGRRPESLDPFGLDRFGDAAPSEVEARRRGLEQYEAIYRDDGSWAQSRR